MFHSRRALHLTPSLPLPTVEATKVLGILFTKQLTWDAHCKAVCKKANQRFHYLRRLKSVTTSNELHLIYTACIRSLLEYACPVFVGLNKKLEDAFRSVDKRAHKIIYGGYERALCGCTKDTISERRKKISKALFKKIETNSTHILNNYLPSVHRHSQHYNIPFCRTSKYMNTFFPYVALLLNSEEQCKSRSNL